MTPRQLARLVKSDLRCNGRPAVAASSQRFFKSYHNAAFFGVTTPDLRRLERDAFKRIKGNWSVEQATAFADLMIVPKELEAKRRRVVSVGVNPARDGLSGPCSPGTTLVAFAKSVAPAGVGRHVRAAGPKG